MAEGISADRHQHFRQVQSELWCFGVVGMQEVTGCFEYPLEHLSICHLLAAAYSSDSLPPLLWFHTTPFVLCCGSSREWGRVVR